MSMPTRLLFRDGWTKYPLRRLLEPLVPHSIAWRKRKIGFEAPQVGFRLDAPEALATVRRSQVIAELGVDLDGLASLPQVMAWRIYALALWESVFL